jgi:hypothetical protein
MDKIESDIAAASASMDKIYNRLSYPILRGDVETFRFLILCIANSYFGLRDFLACM